jgi:NAD(P)-dependent dehydrogenase (short-subunit alcohol dehydrogenase family)
MKVVVVGGTSGIGEAAAQLFAKSGGEVIVAGRDPERLGRAVARLEGVRGVVADGADPESARRLFEGVGPFEHLVLALSGGRGAGPIASVPMEEIRAGFEAKLFAHLTALRAALPFVRSSVTLVSAATAAKALAGTTGLAAINGAIEAVVRPLAAELAPLRVNCVRPGVIDTPWWDSVPKDFKDAAFAQAVQALPVKRVGRPEDVAAAIVMVAQNPFMTGTILDVSGGGTLAR